MIKFLKFKNETIWNKIFSHRILYWRKNKIKFVTIPFVRSDKIKRNFELDFLEDGIS